MTVSPLHSTTHPHRLRWLSALFLCAAVFLAPCFADSVEPDPVSAVRTMDAAAPENSAVLQANALPSSAAVKEPPLPEKSRFAGTFWSLVPPLLAILLALITKEVYSSLFIGIVLGACFAAEFSPLKVVDEIVNPGLIEAVKGTSGIFLFLVLLGGMVSLINKSGAAAAFGSWAQNHIKSRRGAVFATFGLGVLIFIDDYFNCLTVGSVMMPVTDAKKISRAKLAYLIDATAAPICMIAPISSWAAAVSQYADGTEYSGLQLFIRAIPFNFYSLLTIVFIIGITLFNVEFGPMAVHERNAREKDDLFSNGREVDNGIRAETNARGRILDMVIPILLLIGICVFALVYVGGIFDGRGFADAFSNTDAAVALPWGGLVVFAASILYFILRRVISAKDAMSCLQSGFSAMIPAILILTMATALKNMTAALDAKEFIGVIMSGAAAELRQFLPAVIFLAACGLSFSTGTSWGTFGILIPIVINIFPSTSPLLFIGMSACLAGAVCGDHCSPISDTTIMSSAGARCEHLTHVSTQLPYVAAVAAVSFAAYLLAGIVPNWFLVFPAAAAAMLGVIVFFKLRHKNESRENPSTPAASAPDS